LLVHEVDSAFASAASMYRGISDDERLKRFFANPHIAYIHAYYAKARLLCRAHRCSNLMVQCEICSVRPKSTHFPECLLLQ
jgi:hypothetical protein